MRKLVLLFFLFIVGFQISAAALTITSPFGWRTHPITGEWKFHNGVDIAADYGNGIPALYPGRVVYADWYDGYGNTVILDHGDTLYTLYGHCSRLYVSPGQQVEAGQIIAAVGSTGDSTGPHVHISIWKDNQYIDPMTIWQ